MYSKDDLQLRIIKKIELASLITEDDDEFIKFLVSIENAAAVEEFFNKCHGAGGRFCGTDGGRKPKPTDYIKQRVGTLISTAKARHRSAAVAHVTTGAIRKLLGLTSSYGTVKINKLSREKLTNFTDEDLVAVKKQLTTDQRRYNFMHSMGWLTIGATAAAYGIRQDPRFFTAVPTAAIAVGLSRWKTRRIPGQIDRIDREQRRRQGLSLEPITFGKEDTKLPSLAEEIAQATKDIKSAKKIPSDAKLTPSELSELRKVIDAMEPDSSEGITAKMIEGLKTAIDKVKA